MARPDQQDDQPPRQYIVLRDVADALADELEAPSDQISFCLTQLCSKLESGDASSFEDSVHQAARLVANVIEKLGSGQGISFLAQIDPVSFARRVSILEFLRSPTAPLCTLDELHDQLRNFLDFQREIESFLVETGLPSRTWSESPWLFLHLGRLYDTRRTGSPHPCDAFRVPPASAGPADPPYTWVKCQSPTSTLGDGIQYCEYADADVLPGMNADDARRLEDTRQRFFSTRKSVLQALLGHLQQDDAEGLLESCLATIDQNFTPDTISFLLRMDVFYLSGHATKADDIEITPKMSPGGLTNLLEVVGHIEHELLSQRMDRAKRSISSDALNAVFSYEPNPTATDLYLECSQRPDFDKIASVVDAYAQEDSQSRKWWTTFRNRIATWLDLDFRVTIGVDVRPEHAERLIPLIREFVRHSESMVDAGECLVVTPPPVTTNVFRFECSSWTFTFKGTTIAAKHLDGYFYIRELLRQPKSWIASTELRRRIVQWKTGGDSPSQQRSSKVCVGGPNSDLYVALPDAGEAIDEETIESIRKVLEALQEECAAAQAEGDGERAAELGDEIQKLEAYLKANTNHRGEPRHISTERKKAVDAVRNAIDRALDQLQHSHPGLHKHLVDCIELSPNPRYNPDPPVNWET